VNNYHSRKM